MKARMSYVNFRVEMRFKAFCIFVGYEKLKWKVAVENLKKENF